MAITYNKNEKCGEATFTQKFLGGVTSYTVNLYEGNCFLIMVETILEEDTLYLFFLDADHMQRCLENGMFSNYGDTLTEIKINKAKCRGYKKIVELLITYVNNVSITVYEDGEYTWKEYKPAEPVISDEFMREIGEASVSYMYDNDILDDFLEDRGIEMDKEQKSYFGIYDYDDEVTPI